MYILKEEQSFINEIILPAFKEVKNEFGVQPIIVRLSNEGEQEKDPYWSSYAKEAKVIMDNYIKEHKC